MRTQPMVHVLDDDAGVRKSLAWVLQSAELPCTGYESADAFLNNATVDGPSCLLLDMRLPGLSGFDVLQLMKSSPGLTMPVIVLTGNGDVATAVTSMKLGAYDFLEKPADHKILLERVRDALASDAARRARDAEQAEVRRRVALLTQREQQVLDLICEGNSNKQIAGILNISAKTVAIHRWHLMTKMQAGSATDVVRLALRASAA